MLEVEVDTATASGTRLASDGMPILCTLYQAPPGVVRCDHYRGDGVCAVHAARLIECTEWRLRNPEAPTPSTLAPAHSGSSSPPSGTLSLFGDGAPRLPFTSSRRTPRTQAATAVTDRDDVAAGDAAGPRPSPPGLTEADVESFAALRVEMRITGPMGDVWIVPELKDPSRIEMTARHAATVAWFVHTFGTQVAEVHRLNPEVP